MSCRPSSITDERAHPMTHYTTTLFDETIAIVDGFLPVAGFFEPVSFEKSLTLSVFTVFRRRASSHGAHSSPPLCLRIQTAHRKATAAGWRYLYLGAFV